MDINEAYKVLGVAEDASDEEIEKQFMLWTRKNRALNNDQAAKESFDMDAITKAYNLIKNYKRYGAEAPNDNDTVKKKINHFFYYHKLHIVSVIALLALAGSLIYSFVDNYQEKKALEKLPPENIRILLYGEYFNPNGETTQISEHLLTIFPSWKRATVNLNYSPITINDSMDVASQQKSAITLVDDQSDVFIMDDANYERLLTTGIFQPLDESSLKESIEDDKLLYNKTDEDDQEKLYGVILEDTSFLKGLDINSDKKIVAAVKKNAENKQSAIDLLLTLSK